MPERSCVLRTLAGRVVVLLLLVFGLLVLGGCSGSDQAVDEATSSTGKETTASSAAQTAQPTVAEVAPELAVFGELAAIEAPPVSADFDSAGGALDLADGATVTVPAGAFTEDTSLTVTIVGLALGYLDHRVGVASTYVVESDRDLSSLAEPVILELPFPSGIGGVATLRDGEWVGVGVPAGETTRIELTHFSVNYITFVPASVEFIQQLGWMIGRSNGKFLKPSDAERVTMESKHREWVKTGADQSTRDFYGLDESGEYRPPTQTQEEMCKELQTVLAGYSDFSLPDEASPRLDEYALFRFLANADTPRNGFQSMGMKFTGFWDLTSASMDEIEEKILASSAPLTPAQVLQIATDANGGNVSLGLLAAHNYLKDIAYNGRLQADPAPEGANSEVTEKYGEVASQLEPWRQVSPDNSVGRLDKMGSLYHIFAAAVAEVWFATPGMGDAVTFGEQLMRIGFFTAFSEKTGIPINVVFDDKNDVPDIEKGAADLCGVRLGDTVVARRNGEEVPTEGEEKETPVAGEDEPTADLDGIRDGLYVGEVYVAGEVAAPVFEILKSAVELEVSDEGIVATVEYVQRGSGRWGETECIYTIRMLYRGQGPVTDRLSLVLEPVEQEIVALEGNCGAGGGFDESYEEVLLRGFAEQRTRSLAGTFSDGQFDGSMAAGPHGVKAAIGE